MSQRSGLVVNLISSMFAFCLKSIFSFLAVLYVAWSGMALLVAAPQLLTRPDALVDIAAQLLLGAACVGVATVLFAVPVAAFCATWTVFMVGTIHLLDRMPDENPRSSPPKPSEGVLPRIQFLEHRVDPREATCLVCKMVMDENSTTCPTCDTPHHKDCWDYIGGCSRFACPSESTGTPNPTATPNPRVAEPTAANVRWWVLPPPPDLD